MISTLIGEQKVKPTDILVVDIRMNKSKALNELQYKLQMLGIESHRVGNTKDKSKLGKLTKEKVLTQELEQYFYLKTVSS